VAGLQPGARPDLELTTLLASAALAPQLRVLGVGVSR
jgi:hypothetical protein